MDEGGALLPGGQTGQVVVRGASVTSGYDGNPKATEAAFAGDWFKTGDLGYFDDDGYLFLAGRIREMINRGGEKVAPQEVDEVLLDHPAVAEAVTFAVPHATLGEDVASAVVLRPARCGDAERNSPVRHWAHRRLQGAAPGAHRQRKSQKVRPAKCSVSAWRLNSVSRPTPPCRERAVAPRTPLEKVLTGIWAQVLQVEQVGVDDNFFALGGDFLLAIRVLTRLHEIMQVEVAASCIFEAPTVAEMAEHIETLIQAGQAPRPPSAVVRVAQRKWSSAGFHHPGAIVRSCSTRCPTCLFSIFSMRSD